MTIGDPVLLPELLDNLIDNAPRHTPFNGNVTVSTGCDGGAVFISVEDSGPGVSRDKMCNVVERFYRVSGTPGSASRS